MKISPFTASASLWVAIILLTGCATAGKPALAAAGPAAGPGSPSVEIVRDSFGVPHIFGKTDADVAYGLAYANSEDDFGTIQLGLLAARGRLGEVEGESGAILDYALALFGIRELVDREYEHQLSEATRALVEGYASGLNRYAALHGSELLITGLFPVSGKDIIVSTTQKVPLFFGLDQTIMSLLNEKKKDRSSAVPSTESVLASAAGDPDDPADGDGYYTKMGSNVFAVGAGRASDGASYLAVNSHQPWSGPVTWYEAHLKSEEGLDVVGGLFPLLPVVVLGHNRNLGWSFTVSKPDLVDVYRLEVDPKDSGRYLYDGQWRSFETSKVTLGVKLFGPLVWPVEKVILRTVYGPALRTETGTYAIRYANFDRIDVIEELYGMNKAKDFGQWRKAVATQALPCFNIGYADSEGRIFYLYNAHIPIRDEAYNWKGKLDGTTSRTLWTEYLPFERLPMVLDPPSGFIQSCNSSPFETTTGPGNPQESDFSKTLGIETWMTNRALRALELFGADDAPISYEKFFAYKFDMKYSEKTDLARLVARLAADESLSGELERKGRELLASWNLGSEMSNRATALPILTFGQLYIKHEGFSISRLTSIPVPYEELVAAYREALALLLSNFGRIDPEWAQVNRLVHGAINLPLDGAPDVIRAVYGMPQKDGTMIGENGDCYIMMVRWDGKGGLDSQSIHQFGSATARPGSPHYADQAILFAERRFKKVLMDESEIRADAERVYSP